MEQEFNFISRPPVQGPAKHLVVLLHGFGMDARMMEKMGDEIAALMPGAQIVMPHAPEKCDFPDSDDGNLLKVPKIFRDIKKDSVPEIMRQWFGIRGDITAMAARIAAAAQRLNDFIDNQRDMLGLSDRQIAIAGFSQGGGMALYAGLSRPDPVGCVVAHSTPFYGMNGRHSRPSLLYLYGTADEEYNTGIYRRYAADLAAHIDDLEVIEIPGLSHRTSSKSRHDMAHYIARKLSAG
jgi:phospholipase/carboxylesterase